MRPQHSVVVTSEAHLSLYICLVVSAVSGAPGMGSEVSGGSEYQARLRKCLGSWTRTGRRGGGGEAKRRPGGERREQKGGQIKGKREWMFLKKRTYQTFIYVLFWTQLHGEISWKTLCSGLRCAALLVSFDTALS